VETKSSPNRTLGCRFFQTIVRRLRHQPGLVWGHGLCAAGSPDCSFARFWPVLIGSLILRIASQTMGQMLQFYLAHIDRHYFTISYTASGFITASFFVTELLGFAGSRCAQRSLWQEGVHHSRPGVRAIAVQITAMTTAIWLLVDYEVARRPVYGELNSGNARLHFRGNLRPAEVAGPDSWTVRDNPVRWHRRRSGGSGLPLPQFWTARGGRCRSAT
jgi:hypothetical protein